VARYERHGFHARRLRKSTRRVGAAAISSIGHVPSSIKQLACLNLTTTSARVAHPVRSAGSTSGSRAGSSRPVMAKHAAATSS
jgi:hypothetical protein